MRLEGWQIITIVVLAIILFGAPKLPGLARSIGQSLRIFKSEVRQLKDENNATETDPLSGGTVPPAPAAPATAPPAPASPGPAASVPLVHPAPKDHFPSTPK